MPSEFKQKVINIVRSVPRGRVVSYGQVALMADKPRAAQAVGWILHDYGDDGITSWWRVVNNAGRVSTKCLEHTALMQKDLLMDEGIYVDENLNLDIERYRYIPDM